MHITKLFSALIDSASKYSQMSSVMIGCQVFSMFFFEVVDQLLTVKLYLRHSFEVKICETYTVTLGAGEDVSFAVCASLVMLSPEGAKKQSADA